ncbi:MAG: monooxygenase, partial [Acidimicrobiales bacterium]|nr:monooxygenase [Acidimicrobiales bacterium]
MSDFVEACVTLARMIEIPSGTRVFGIQLPVQSQSASFVGEWEARSGPTDLARMAKTADDTGYHYVGVCDHVTLPESVVGGMGTLW